MRKLVLALVAASAAYVFAACASDNAGQACKADSECARGMVCNATKLVCEVRPCTSNADCAGTGQVCVLLPGATSKVCTAIECVPGVVECPDGKVCKDNLCEDQAVLPDTVAPDAQEEAVEEVAQETVTPISGEDCKPCTGATDCEKGYSCSAVGAGKFCLKNCTSNAECRGGYVCYPVSSAGKQCLPMSYACVECAYKGCDVGKVCDLVSGQCVDQVKECGKCTYDFQCGDGNRCYKKAQATTGVCVAECPNDTCADSTKFTCNANPDGVKVCQPNKEEDCQPCPPGQVLLGDGKTCAECQNDAQCLAKDKSKPKCDPTTHTCVEELCPAETKKCSDNKCHQCCVDADCAGLGGTGKCVNYGCEGVQDECQKAGIDCSTNPYYPACCVINGTPQCCGCASDADCAKQYPEIPGCTCSSNMCIDPTTYQQCGGGVSQCAATCQSDADCPPSASGGLLSCKLPKGFCYDPSGSCDGVAACCNPGQICFDVMSLLFGGMGGGMPIPGGGGMPMMMPACSCTTSADCLGGGNCTDLAMVCMLPLIGQMFCPGGAPPSTAPKALCIDLSKLLGGI